MSKKNELPIYLDTLEVKNFRLFEHLKMMFHPELTVIVAPNSGGKTAVLDAVHSLLTPIIYDDDFSYSAGDIRHNIDSSPYIDSFILVSLNIQEKYQQSLSLISNNNPFSLLNKPTTLKIKDYTSTFPYIDESEDLELKKWGGYSKRKNLKANDEFINTFQSFDLFSTFTKKLKILPLFSYFTANRRSDPTKKRVTASSNISNLSRTDAYKSLLSIKHNTNLAIFEDWLRERELTGLEERLEIEQEGLSDTSVPDSHLNAVTTVLASILEKEIGIKTVKYFAKSKKIQAVKENGDRLDIDQLSHGSKSALIIAGELAMHCCALNPHLKEQAPAKTPGIVLIDEIDLHLHPKWQQHIITDLRRCFPLMQFIITTHSPQILSTVKRENIRVLGKNAEGQMVASEPLAYSYGEPSGDVMHSIMQVDPLPPINEKKDLENLTTLVDQGLYDSEEAKMLRTKLTESLDIKNHSQLKKIERSIQRQKVLGK